MLAHFDFASKVALSAAAVAVAATLLLFLYAIGLRLAHMSHDRLKRRIRADYWPIFAEAVVSDHFAENTHLPVSVRRHKTQLLREWCRFRSIIRGSAASNLNTLARRLGLLEFARKRLTLRALGGRLLAIQAVGLLRDRSCWSTLEPLLDQPNIALSITAATSLADIDPERAIPIIIPLVVTKKGWPRTQVGRILNSAGLTIVSRRLCEAIETSPLKDAIQLMRFMDAVSTTDVNRLMSEILDHRDEPELLAAALKVARGHLSADKVSALASHDAWYVRMQAANLLAKFGAPDSIKILEKMLSDTEWWVRYRAAQAITKLPFLGPNALRRLCDRQADRFARDIMRQALAERGLA